MPRILSFSIASHRCLSIILLIAGCALCSRVESEDPTSSAGIVYQKYTNMHTSSKGAEDITRLSEAPSGLSVTKCLDLCNGNSECGCATFVTADGKCLLRKNCRPSGFKAKEGNDVYVKHSAPNDDPTDAVVIKSSKGIDYRQYEKMHTSGEGAIDITKVSRALSGLSVMACLDACDGNEDCDCVTFKRAVGNCWLRKHCWPPGFKRRDENDVYVKRCAPTGIVDLYTSTTQPPTTHPPATHNQHAVLVYALAGSLAMALIGCGLGCWCMCKQRKAHARTGGRQLEFKGRFVSGQRFFVASFPGAFSEDWQKITQKHKELSIACVFFPDGDSEFYGKHCVPCKCKDWYENIDPEYHVWDDGKAPFGCLWSQRWHANCQECLGVGQIPVVVYKPGNVRVRSPDGLGWSQMGEVQRLVDITQIFECDLDAFMTSVLPKAREKRPLPPS